MCCCIASVGQACLEVFDLYVLVRQQVAHHFGKVSTNPLEWKATELFAPAHPPPRKGAVEWDQKICAEQKHMGSGKAHVLPVVCFP